MNEVRLEAVSRRIGSRDILREVNLEAGAGELVCVCGRSGSGKTTLLAATGGLDRPDSGRVFAGGVEITALDEAALAAYRLGEVGFVFQAAGLVALMTALENVAFSLEVLGVPEPDRGERALEALRLVGLQERSQHRAFELSGGEQLRVSLARALVKRPRLLLADEPTGQLDSETGAMVLGLLREATRTGTAVIVATHDQALAERADRVYAIDDGTVSEVRTGG